MTVRVLLFAWLAEQAGNRELDVDLPEGATVADAIDAAANSLGTLLDPATFAVACNERYSDLHQKVGDGDVVALIPPVSGG